PLHLAQMFHKTITHIIAYLLFIFTAPPPTKIYTLSLHDALPISTPIMVIVYLTYQTYLKNIEASKAQAEQAERHMAEMRKSEERFRSAFEHAAGMAIVAADGRWVKVNRSLCEMVGYSEPELLATCFQAITHPDD